MKKILLVCFAASLIVAFSLQTTSAAFIVHPGNATNTENPAPASVSSAVSEFMHLSRKERKMRIRDAKAELKKFKAEKKAQDDPSTNEILLVILAIILPPLAVYLHEGVINGKFWLDLILTLLFFIPGIIYALIVVLKK